MFNKKLLLVFALCFVVFLGASPAFAGEVGLQFNNKPLQGDVEPVIESGRTLVPLRAICDALGANIVWENDSGTVKIQKSGKEIKLKLDSKEVYVNGQRSGNLEVPARSIDGRAMVPVRFVSETLGAQVNWDAQTRTVSIIHEEKKDNMLPEELYAKSNQAMLNVKSYRFNGKGTTKTTTLGQTMEGEVTLEGAFKAPAEMYLKEVVKSANEFIKMDIPIEMYVRNNKEVYTRVMDQDWQKVDIELPDNLNNEPGAQKQDPTQVLKELEEFGLIFSYGDEAVIEGKSYYVLHTRIDQEKYKNKLIETVDQMKLPAGDKGIVIDEAKMKEELKNTYRNMKFDVSYKIFIDKQTFYITRMEVGSYTKMKMAGFSGTKGEIVTYLDLVMNLTDFGQEVTMPQVN